MILLVGATGRLGTAVAERLLLKGLSFRAASRNVEKAHGLAKRGVDVVRLDLDSGAGLPEAISGVDKVVTCVHGLLGKSRDSINRIDGDGHRRLIDASAREGVKRFVYISALGAAVDHPSEFWRAKARTEQYLRLSGLEFVILRPSAFMDLYAHDLIGAAVLRRKTVYLLGSGSWRRNLIAVSDVAEAVLKALLEPELAGQSIDLAGWDNLTEREVAQVYADLCGHPPKVRSVPAALIRAGSSAVAPFHSGVARILRTPLLLAGRSDLCGEPSAAMRRLGIDPVRLAQFARSKIKTDLAAIP